jgi:hypothetical protein
VIRNYLTSLGERALDRLAKQNNKDGLKHGINSTDYTKHRSTYYGRFSRVGWSFEVLFLH